MHMNEELNGISYYEHVIAFIMQKRYMLNKDDHDSEKTFHDKFLNTQMCTHRYICSEMHLMTHIVMIHCRICT